MLENIQPMLRQCCSNNERKERTPKVPDIWSEERSPSIPLDSDNRPKYPEMENGLKSHCIVLMLRRDDWDNERRWNKSHCARTAHFDFSGSPRFAAAFSVIFHSPKTLCKQAPHPCWLFLITIHLFGCSKRAGPHCLLVGDETSHWRTGTDTHHKKSLVFL